MKKTLFMAALAAVVGLVSCSKPAEQQEVVYSIDEVFEQAESLTEDTITFQGVCAHLCKHGGRKAFLMGTKSDTTYTENDTIVSPRILRVEGAEMGNFDAACINNIVRVKGVLHSFEYQPEPTDDPAEKHGTTGQGCETEKKAIKGYYATAISYTIVSGE